MKKIEKLIGGAVALFMPMVAMAATITDTLASLKTILNAVIGLLFVLVTVYFIWGVMLLAILLLGISFFISIVSVKYHDIKHLVELILQLVFWATPVFYKLEQLPTKIAAIISTFNPLVIILDLIRAGVLSEIPKPDIGDALIKSLIIITFTFAGLIFFKKSIPKIAEFF